MKNLLLVARLSFISLLFVSRANSFQIESSRDDHCHFNQTSCLRLACESMGTFACKREPELKQILEACRDNYGSACLKQSLTYLTFYEYNDLREMVSLIRSCKGVFDLQCPVFTCERLGVFYCKKLSGIIKANQLCGEN